MKDDEWHFRVDAIKNPPRIQAFHMAGYQMCGSMNVRCFKACQKVRISVRNRLSNVEVTPKVQARKTV